MMVTTKVHYAINAISYMASKSSDNPVTIMEISTKHGVDARYLEQLFVKLRRSGIVRSVRGPGGGYVLCYSPSELTIEQVAIAVDENLEMTRCKNKEDKRCSPDGLLCKSHVMLCGLTRCIREYLRNKSIADILNANF